jgi:hypothetical protein
MRIENRQIPQITDKPTAAAASKPSGASATAHTSDVVALSYNLQLSGTSSAQAERDAAVASLKHAYEAGAIRPDPARVAGRLIAWSSSQDGE